MLVKPMDQLLTVCEVVVHAEVSHKRFRSSKNGVLQFPKDVEFRGSWKFVPILGHAVFKLQRADKASNALLVPDCLAVEVDFSLRLTSAQHSQSSLSLSLLLAIASGKEAQDTVFFARQSEFKQPARKLRLEQKPALLENLGVCRHT